MKRNYLYKNEIEKFYLIENIESSIKSEEDFLCFELLLNKLYKGINKDLFALYKTNNYYAL